MNKKVRNVKQKGFKDGLGEIRKHTTGSAGFTLRKIIFLEDPSTSLQQSKKSK